LELVQSYDETEYINSSIHLVTQNIWVGGLLTISVLLLFLRSGRSTLVIALAIPTSLIGTFLLLNLMGRSLNVISLAGLAFAVGMLVDNAVVVLENCYRHAQLGDNPICCRGARSPRGLGGCRRLDTHDVSGLSARIIRAGRGRPTVP
jgi:HAE1 family hydrophobic/amphiphilic exporter-1